MSDITICYVVLAGVVLLFIWNRIPVEIVALGAALSLWATGVLTFGQSLAGFGDPTVSFIAALFVVSEGLDASGVTAWVGQELVRRAGLDARRLMLLAMVAVALLSALITINGAVAALLPVVVVLAIRLKRPPSKMLLPLAFGAHAGQLLTLSGSPVNVVVSDAAVNGGQPAFSYFSYAIVGIPLVLGVIAFVLVFGDRLLPVRTPEAMPADLSAHAHTLLDQYLLDERSRNLRLEEGSPWIGRSVEALGLDAFAGVALIAVRRAGERLAAGDVVVLRGEMGPLDAVAAHARLVTVAESGGLAPAIFGADAGAAEVVVPPRSGLVGTTAFPGMVTDSGDLIVLAVHRNGKDAGPGATVLAPGDALLLEGTWDALDRHLGDPDVLAVEEPARVRRQAAPLGGRARATLVILTAMVVLLATGAVPPAAAALLAAGALILARVVSVDEAYRAISWTTVVLVGAMIPLSTAMQVTGAANQLADGLVSLVGDHGSYALLVGIFVLTAVLGQLISNTATALIVTPIAVSAAIQLDISPRPLLMTVAVAAGASFLTPVATPVNLMVMGPAGYRFGDYWKLGLPLLLLFLAVSVAVIPLVWPF
jgi:di/tricarboxylate transporter